MRSYRWALTQYDWCSRKKMERSRGWTNSEERPCEGIARRGPSTSQRGPPQEKPNLPTPWSWTSSLWEISFCVSHSVSGTFFLQWPELTRPLIESCTTRDSKYSSWPTGHPIWGWRLVWTVSLQWWRPCYISNFKWSPDAQAVDVKPKHFIVKMISMWPVLQLSLVGDVTIEPQDLPGPAAVVFNIRKDPVK